MKKALCSTLSVLPLVLASGTQGTVRYGLPGYLYVRARVRSSCHQGMLCRVYETPLSLRCLIYHQGMLCRVGRGVTRATVRKQGWRRMRSEASNALMRAKVTVTLVMPRLLLLSASHARGSDLFRGLQ